MEINRSVYLNHSYSNKILQTVYSKNVISRNGSYKETSFRGHAGHEDFANNAITKLIHETAFFRESTTDEFLKSFILKNWKNKANIKIICGACSTGEEAITLSMLLDEIKDKVSILGVDISQNAIKEANSRKYKMEYYPRRNTDADQDYYLWFDNADIVSEKQAEYKKLFDDFFEISKSDNVEKIKLSKLKSINNCIKQCLINFINNFVDSLDPLVYKKTFKLRKNKAANVQFIQGDINDINVITSRQKADVITFRNAFYHLLNGYKDEERYLLPDAKDILDKILKKIYQSLNPNGLIVIGHRENLQTRSDKLIENTLCENNFQPLNSIMGMATVWQKID